MQISLTKVGRNFNIASMNVDTIRTNNSTDSILRNIEKDEIDIVCIQETRNNKMIQRKGYAINFIYGEIKWKTLGRIGKLKQELQ